MHAFRVRVKRGNEAWLGVGAAGSGILNNGAPLVKTNIRNMVPLPSG